MAMIVSAAITAVMAATAFTGTPTTSATSIWAGLGHHGRERAGFTATERYGHTTYKVWTQAWPNPYVAVPEVARQGDYVSVHIRYLGGTRYAIGITDRNQGWHFDRTV